MEKVIEQSHIIVPLNNPQKRIWFIGQQEDASIAYNNHSIYKVEGLLNVEILEEAVGLLIKKYSSLRSTFILSDGTIFQKIYRDKISDNFFNYYDYELEGTNEIDLILTQLSNNKFDLYNGNLFSFFVIKRSTNSYFIGLVAHHIISDGLSFQIFFSELFDCYKQLTENSICQISDLDNDYYQYSLKRRESETSLDAEKFWKDAFLDCESESSSLNYDFEKGQRKTYLGKRIQFHISYENILSIKSIAFKARTGILPVFLLIQAIFLHKVLNRKQVVIGTLLTGRNPDNQMQIGMYVNTIPCLFNIDTSLTFIDSLNKFLTFFKDAYKYQNYPLEEILKNLQISRTANRTPLFENIFILQPKKESWDLNGTIFENYKIDRKISLFDTTIEVTETKDKEWILEWEYDSSLFTEETIQTYYTYYYSIVRNVLSNPSILVKDIRIV